MLGQRGGRDAGARKPAGSLANNERTLCSIPTAVTIAGIMSRQRFWQLAEIVQGFKNEQDRFAGPLHCLLRITDRIKT